MKLKNPLLAVRDMERSKTFYREVLGLHVVMDFGANVTLTGGLCLQTLDTWTDFLGKEAEEIRFGANDSEVYFEEDDFDGFLAHLVVTTYEKVETIPLIVIKKDNNREQYDRSKIEKGVLLACHKKIGRAHV